MEVIPLAPPALPRAAPPALVYVPHPLMVATRRRLIDAHALPGESLEAYLRRALPDVPVDDPRLVWVAAIAEARVPRAMWRYTFPKPGMTVWLTLSVAGGGGGGGKNPLATVLSIGLFFAAPYLGAALANAVGGAGFAGTTAFSVFGQAITYGKIFGGLVSIAGSLLIGRLFQPSRPQLTQASGAQAAPSPTYSITGGANRARRFESMAITMGRHIAFLDYGAKPYNEYEGEDQYLFQIFHAGLSDVVLSQFRIGNTAIESYPGVTIQESGADGKITLCPGNVDTIAGGDITKAANGWVQRTSSPDAIALALDLSGQLFGITEDSGLTALNEIYLNIHYRAVGSSTWLDWTTGVDIGVTNTTIVIQNGSRKPVRRTYKRDVARGQYEVRAAKISADNPSERAVYEVTWTQFRTYQPDDTDYTGQKRVGVKIRASSIAQGQLDQFNCIASARHEAWTGSAWELRETSNPAWIARWFLLGKKIGGRRAFGADKTDADLDLASFKAFGAWCDLKNLTCNVQMDFNRPVGEMLDAILRCGRGRHTYASGKIGVVWDQGGQPDVASFGMANIVRETFSVEYVSEETPDGVVVRFINPANNWEQDEVRCARPGVADPVNYALMEILGCTDLDMAGREGNLAAAAYEYLRRRVTLEQDMEGVVTTAGDVVTVSHDLTQWAFSGRLLAGTTTTLTLDRQVPFTSGYQHYVRLEFPNKYFKVLRVRYEGADTDVLTLLDVLPTVSPKGVTLYAASADPDHPPHDYKWSFEPKATPGRLMKVIGQTFSADRVQFTLSDETDAYYAAEYRPYEYVPAGGSLTAAPTLDNVQVVEDLVRSGSGFASLITVTWDVIGVSDITIVRAAFVGEAMEEKARTYGRRAEFLVGAVGAYQATIQAFGPRGQWSTAGSRTVDLTILGAGGKPPAVSTFSIDGDTLRWAPVNWANLAGYRLRYHFGDYRSWTDAAALVSGLVTESAYTMVPRPAGPLTLMIKPVTTQGVEADVAAVIVTDLGDPIIDHLLFTRDFKVEGFPGTITGGALSGGNLLATGTTAFYGPDDSAPLFGPNDSDPIYKASNYLELTYETPEFVPEPVLPGSTMTLATTLAGSPYFLEYRAPGSAPFFTGSDANPIFGPDDGEPLFDAPPPYEPWPGSIAIVARPYQLRARIAQGGTQGAISAFAAVFDAPTIEEAINDFAVAAGGARLPLTLAFSQILNVQLTLEADGGTATSAKYLDKDAALGPLIRCFDSANVGAAGTVDARVKGI